MSALHQLRAQLARCGARAALAALLAPSLAAQYPQLYPVPVFPSGGGFSFVAADLDLDGLPDLVSDGALSDPFTPVLAVCRSLPVGGFSPPIDSYLGMSGVGLAVADVNGDGWPDVLACDSAQQNFGVALGLGGGALAPASSYFVGGTLQGVAAGDVDGDGLVDVVTTSSASPVALNVNRADGTGGFLLAEHHPLAITPGRLQLADLDSDGRLDAIFPAISGTSSLLAVAFGDGAGSFGAPVSRAVPAGPSDVVVRDLDGDGDLDLATPCFVSQAGPGVVAIVRGDGLGGLAPAESWTVGAQPVALAVSDLNGDDALDLVTADHDTQQVSVRLADGAGGYASVHLFDSALRGEGVVMLDANADGRPDVVVWNSDGLVGVLPGDGAGGVQPGEQIAADAASALTIADIDGQYGPDLVESSGISVEVLRADGAGGFLPPMIKTYAQSFGASQDLTVGDLNGDAAPDVVVATQQALVVLLNDGSGALRPGQKVSGSSSGLEVRLADLDGDGALDALETNLITPQNYPYPGRILRYSGTPAGVLEPPAAFPAGDDPDGFALADLDGDGHIDAAVADFYGPGLSVLRGDGLGGFLPPAQFGSAPFSREVALGDLDLDGHLDVALLEQVHSVVTVFAGDGAGGFVPGPTFTGTDSFVNSTALAIADMDGDGWPDIAVTTGLTNSVDVGLNDGAGGLLPAQGFAGGTKPGPLALADIDGDHRPDLVASDGVSQDPPRLTVLRNHAVFTWTDLGFALPGTHGAPQLVGTGTLTPGSPGDLRLFHARPLSLAALFVSGTSQPTPFKGGTLVPVPPIVHLTVITDGAGSLTLGWSSWPSNAPGQDWFFQYAIVDVAAVHGVALSNGLRAVEP